MYVKAVYSIKINKMKGNSNISKINIKNKNLLHCKEITKTYQSMIDVILKIINKQLKLYKF